MVHVEWVLLVIICQNKHCRHDTRLPVEGSTSNIQNPHTKSVVTKEEYTSDYETKEHQIRLPLSLIHSLI